MSIDAKHFYRFEYLESEAWKTVRAEALAREGGKCQICNEESVFNDAHHVWYPEGSIFDTVEAQLVILCRPCHDFLHTVIPDCKTSDERKGRSNWNRFRNGIAKWQVAKVETMQLLAATSVNCERLRIKLIELYEENKRLTLKSHSPINRIAMKNFLSCMRNNLEDFENNILGKDDTQV